MATVASPTVFVMPISRMTLGHAMRLKARAGPVFAEGIAADAC